MSPTWHTYGPFVLAALWALGSAQLFVRGWLAAADLVIAVIAVLRGRITKARGAQMALGAWLVGVVCSVLIRVGFWVVELLGYHRKGLEEIAYWVCALSFVSYFARRAPAKVRKSWHAVMTPQAEPFPVPPADPGPAGA